MGLFLPSFCKRLLSTHYVPDPVLGIGEIAVREIHKTPSPVSLGSPVNLSSSLQLRGTPLSTPTPLLPWRLCAANWVFHWHRWECWGGGRQPSRNPALQDAFPVSSLSIMQLTLSTSPVPGPVLVNQLTYSSSTLSISTVIILVYT